MTEENKAHSHHPAAGEEKPAAESATAGEGAPAGVEGKEGKAKKPAKEKAKKKKVEKKPKAPKAPKDGVIKTILECMQGDQGASVEEIVGVLKSKFPERKTDAMTTTIRIQVSRLPQRCGFEMKKTQDEKRGLVYKAPKSARLDKKKEKPPTAAEGEKK